jgi:pyridinium-3,5-bisthiocarboxylic acid mononucleotide nickel chelatase
MFLGALIDAGVPFQVLQNAVASLDLGAKLALHRVDRSGIDAAKVDVLTEIGEIVEVAHATSMEGREHSHTRNHENEHSHDHVHGQAHAEGKPHVHGRSLSEIEEIIRGSGLADGVKATALKAFHLLGAAEAKIHNVPVEAIHFHEVGAVDAIADIVGVAAGCHWLEVERWICSPLNVGGGHVHCAHGKFPVPAPATLELLRDLAVYSSGVKKELVTPTGAALLRALDVTSSGLPAMSVSATGYGAGSKDIPGEPNVLRLVVGESGMPALQSKGSKKNRIGIIETTIDDATPELLSYVADCLLAAGASDVYRVPIQMKKGRVGIQLTIFCSPDRAEALQKLVFLETTTLGLRYREEEKRSLVRNFINVETEWGQIRIKLGLLDGEVVNYAPEYEDCRAIAERHAVPLKQVMQAAVSAWRAQGSPA